MKILFKIILSILLAIFLYVIFKNSFTEEEWEIIIGIAKVIGKYL